MSCKASFSLLAVVVLMVCSCCGSASHRIEKCQYPGAEQIRKLRAQLRSAQGGSSQSKDVFKNERQGRGYSSHKELAMKAYTPHAAEDKARAEQRHDHKANRDEVLQQRAGCRSDEKSLSTLWRTGF